MASVLYPDYKESCLGGGTHSFSDLTEAGSDVIKCRLATSGVYTYGAADADAQDVTKYVGTTDQTLASKTVTAGVFDAADLTFSSVNLDGANDVDQLVHFKFDTGDSTSPVICYHDGFAPVTPNGGDITVSYHSSGIFEL